LKLALLDDYQGVALAMADWAPVRARAEITVFRKAFASPDAAAAALADFDVIGAMRERTRFPRDMLARLPKLKCIVTTGMQNAAIDMAAARERGIIVSGTTNGPGGHATAELAWALLLALARRIPAEDAAMRAGEWQTFVGTVLYGKTIGLIGLGRIGSLMAGYARAFGMNVIAWSPRLTDERAASVGAKRMEKDALLAEADIVSLHVALNDGTRGLIGANELARMKPGALLVNTARGPVVDEAALLAALREGRLAGAALDVFDREPLPAGHPLLAVDGRVVLSPHIGYVAQEVYRAFYGDTAEAILAFLDGKPVRVLNAG